MIKVTYIFHDCFLMELPECSIVFDFWKDPAVSQGELPGFLSRIRRELPLYIFVSHHHKDHYSKKIFDWQKYFPNIKYIISDDVARMARHIITPDSLYAGTKPSPDDVVILKRGDVYKDSVLSAEAYGSTDIGNSYYIEVRGAGEKRVSVFHAGDLNAWIWKDESTPQEVDEALNAYLDIVRSIQSRHSEIDFVMFPVDSRIGTDYFEGAKIFVREIDVRRFFPMHFGLFESKEEERSRIKDAADLDAYANKQRGEYICLTSPYSAYLTNGVD